MKSRGSFVASSVDELRNERKSELVGDLEKVLQELQALGMEYAEAEQILQGSWKGVKHD